MLRRSRGLGLIGRHANAPSTAPLGILSALGIFLFAASACGAPPGGQDALQNAQAVTDSPLVLTVTTDQPRYAPGDSVSVTLLVANRSSAPVTLQFSSGQRYDFTIGGDGTTLWRWSDDRAFIQMLGEERLEPGAELIYRERAKAPAAPGTYRVTGMLTAQDRLRQASVAISVVP